MEEKTWGIGSVLAGVVVLILLFSIFSNGTWGFNGSRNCYEPVSNCEVEKQGLITAAETNFRIIDENRKSSDMLSAQLRAQYDANQAEKIFDLKLNNVMQQNAFNLALMEKNSTIERMTLANSINDRFNAIDTALGSINCHMLKRPELYGYAVSCPTSAVNPFGSCGCGTNGLV